MSKIIDLPHDAGLVAVDEIVSVTRRASGYGALNGTILPGVVLHLRHGGFIDITCDSEDASFGVLNSIRKDVLTAQEESADQPVK